MERKEYSAGAVKHSFWFVEFRNEVKLLSEGKRFEEIKELCRNENIFAASTPERAVQIFNTVSSRIKAMGDTFYPMFLQGDASTQRIFNLAAIMASDTLFFDFVYDPCMGSGHILVYTFDVLMQIYESYGYSQRDAARSIIEVNPAPFLCPSV